MDLEKAASNEGPLDDVEIRRRAAGRVWICPGAGYALVGRPALAVASYVANLVVLLGLGWFVVAPNRVIGWASLVVVGAVAMLWGFEMSVVKRAALRPAAPSALVSGYRAAAAIGWLAGGAVGISVIFFFGTLVTNGGGMVPTINNGEKVVYHKSVQAEELRRGRVIVFRTSDQSAWSPGALVIARIVAIPGDRISTNDGRIFVNGNPATPVGNAPSGKIALIVPADPAVLTVPDECYFMNQDDPEGAYDSRVLWWTERKNVVSSRIWYLRRDQLLNRVE